MSVTCSSLSSVATNPPVVGKRQIINHCNINQPLVVSLRQSAPRLVTFLALFPIIDNNQYIEKERSKKKKRNINDRGYGAPGRMAR